MKAPGSELTNPYPVKKVVRDLDRLGYKRIILKSDQEAPILAVARAVKETWSGEIVPERAPRDSKQSNGEAERAVQSAQAMTRTLKEHVQSYTRMELDARSPIIAWAVEYGAILL